MQKFTLQNVLQLTTSLFLFLLPWQTIWIIREPIVNGAKWEFGTLGIYASEVLLWVVVVLFMLLYWKRNKEQGTRNKFTFSKDRIFLLAILSLISYLLLSIFWSADKELALQHSLHIIEAFLLFFILWLGPLSFAAATRWFIGGAVVQSILGLTQFFTQSSFVSKWLGITMHPAWISGTSIVQGADTGRWLRAYGAFPHPNVLGGYLVVALILLLFFYSKVELKNKLSLISYHLSLIFVLTGLFFTFSRSAWIAAIIVLLFYCSIVKKLPVTRYWLPITTTIITVAILTILFFPLVKTRIIGESPFEIKSTSERVTGYHEAWQLFKQYPMLGVGAGNYTVALQSLNPNQPGYVHQPVHNSGALGLVELGIVGLVLLLCVIVSFITYHVSCLRYAMPGKLLSPISYLFYSLPVTGYTLLALFDHYLLSLYVGLLLSAVLWGMGTRFVHELSTE